MLMLAEVNGRDTVYDIGSEDGSIAIDAAKKFGAYGVSIGLAPRWLDTCSQQARKALVADRVRFKQTNLSDADMRNATVVTLYLSANQNISLRPKLFEQLKPGTRIVSRNSDMEEWQPDKILHIDDDLVFYWIVPANATGIWEWKIDQRDFAIKIDQYFQKAHISDSSDKNHINGHILLEGKQIKMELTGDEANPYVYTGVLEDDKISGFVLTPSGSWYPWEAHRERHTIRPIIITDQTKKQFMKKTVETEW